MAAVKALGDVRQVLAAGLPQLERLSSAEDTIDGGYELRVRIRECTGGVGLVEIRINGSLIEGRTVSTRDDNLDSKTAEAVITARPSGKRPTLHVLAVGVSHDEDAAFATEGIRFAGRDAEAFAAKLRERGEGLYENFKIPVLSKPDEVRTPAKR